MENNEEVNEFITLILYMKSGNTIYVDKVKNDVKVQGEWGGGIRSISDFTQDKSAVSKLHLHALDLSQIEAITWS